jgi:hypothetical protein
MLEVLAGHLRMAVLEVVEELVQQEGQRLKA